MPFIEKIKEKLGDYNVLLKHMDFLQNNGFSDYGKGHIVGQIDLLEEYLREAGKSQEEVIDIQSEKSRNIKEPMVVADNSRVQEEKQGRDSGSGGRMVADIIYEKGKIVISKQDSNNKVGNNTDYYYNESNSDLPERQRQRFIKAEYSKKIDDNNNIMNNELSSQKESHIAQILYSPSNNDITDEDRRNNYNNLKVKEVHNLKMEDNKVTKQSWRDRIKGMANNIEDWR